MKIIISLKIKAVGFSNTFAQDELKDPPVYMYYPPTVNLGRDTVLSFNNSLPAITKTFHTWKNDQELINIFGHKIYSFYIHLWLTYHRP